MTPTDHANTVADLVGDVRASLNDPERKTEASRKKYHAAHVALDALQAQAEEPRVFALEAAASRRRAEAAEAERDKYKAIAEKKYGFLAKRVIDAEAERDRLRDALREIVGDAYSLITQGESPTQRRQPSARRIYDRARAALARTEHTPPECNHSIIEIDDVNDTASCAKCGAKL